MCEVGTCVISISMSDDIDLIEPLLDPILHDSDENQDDVVDAPHHEEQINLDGLALAVVPAIAEQQPLVKYSQAHIDRLRAGKTNASMRRKLDKAEKTAASTQQKLDAIAVAVPAVARLMHLTPTTVGRIKQTNLEVKHFEVLCKACYFSSKEKLNIGIDGA